MSDAVLNGASKVNSAITLKKTNKKTTTKKPLIIGSVWVAEWLMLLTVDHEVVGLNPTGGRIHLMTVLAPFHHLDMKIIITCIQNYF